MEGDSGRSGSRQRLGKAFTRFKKKIRGESPARSSEGLSTPTQATVGAATVSAEVPPHQAPIAGPSSQQAENLQSVGGSLVSSRITPDQAPGQHRASASNTTVSVQSDLAALAPTVDPSSEVIKQNSPHLELWERAADSLGPEDRQKLDAILERSTTGVPNGSVGDAPVNPVDAVLASAKRLQDEDENATWQPVSSI